MRRCAQITSLEFAPDGRTLYSGDEDGCMSAWDLDQAKRLHHVAAHSGPVWSLAASRGSGALLASGEHTNIMTRQYLFIRSLSEDVDASVLAGAPSAFLFQDVQMQVW